MNNLESKLMSAAITAAQKFFNKGILIISYDEKMNECFAFRTSKEVKPSKAINDLASTWNYDFKRVAEFIIENSRIAYSVNLFKNIEIMEN